MKRTIAILAGAVFAGLYSVSAFAAECPRVVGFDWSIPHKIDPANADSQADSLHIWGVYEPLIWIDPDYNLLPWLAESWEANEDGTVWTFQLRQGVKFHDGSDFDATDVVYTYRRIKDPATGSPGTGQLEVFENEGVQAIDTHTVQFTLKQPNAELPLLISGRVLAHGAGGRDHRAARQWLLRHRSLHHRELLSRLAAHLPAPEPRLLARGAADLRLHRAPGNRRPHHPFRRDHERAGRRGHRRRCGNARDAGRQPRRRAGADQRGRLSDPLDDGGHPALRRRAAAPGAEAGAGPPGDRRSRAARLRDPDERQSHPADLAERLPFRSHSAGYREGEDAAGGGGLCGRHHAGPLHRGHRPLPRPQRDGPGLQGDGIRGGDQHQHRDLSLGELLRRDLAREALRGVVLVLPPARPGVPLLPHVLLVAGDPLVPGRLRRVDRQGIRDRGPRREARALQRRAAHAGGGGRPHDARLLRGGRGGAQGMPLPAAGRPQPLRLRPRSTANDGGRRCRPCRRRGRQRRHRLRSSPSLARREACAPRGGRSIAAPSTEPG